MSALVRTPHTTRGPEALRAALEDLELDQRMDPRDEPLHERYYELGEEPVPVTERFRAAAATDVLTPDEAVAELAVALGRESPFDEGLEDAYER